MPRTHAPRPAAVTALLLDLLDRGYDKSSWHGPNLSAALRGVDAAAAARRLGERKTIWEQALHAAYWKQRVVSRLAGTRRFPRRGSNWPLPPDDPAPAAWKEDLRLLGDVHAALRETVRTLPPSALTPVALRMIQGIAFHDVYHAGQIKLLRRLIEGPKAR